MRSVLLAAGAFAIATLALGCSSTDERTTDAARRAEQRQQARELAGEVELLLEVMRPDEAFTLSTEMLRLDPNAVQINRVAAIAQAAKAVKDHDPKSYDEAVRRATYACEADPYDAESFYTRGKLQYDRRYFTHAAADFATVLEQDPEHVNGLRMAAFCQRSLRNPKAERRAWQRMIELVPGDADAHYELGASQLASEDKADHIEGRRMIERAAELDASHARALQALATLSVDEGDLELAEGLLQRAVEAAPTTFRRVDALYNLGVVQQQRQELIAARATYEACLADDPDHVRASANLGMLLLEQGETELGREHLRAALELGLPGNAERAIRALLGEQEGGENGDQNPTTGP